MCFWDLCIRSPVSQGCSTTFAKPMSVWVAFLQGYSFLCPTFALHSICFLWASVLDYDSSLTRTMSRFSVLELQNSPVLPLNCWMIHLQLFVHNFRKSDRRIVKRWSGFFLFTFWSRPIGTSDQKRVKRWSDFFRTNFLNAADRHIRSKESQKMIRFF
jgi:hypothetical protein